MTHPLLPSSQAAGEGGGVAGLPRGAEEGEGGVEGGESVSGGRGRAAASEVGDCEAAAGRGQGQFPRGTEGPGGGKQVRKVGRSSLVPRPPLAAFFTAAKKL